MTQAFAHALRRVAALLLCREKTEKSSRKEEADRKDENEKVRQLGKIDQDEDVIAVPVPMV